MPTLGFKTTNRNPNYNNYYLISLRLMFYVVDPASQHDSHPHMQNGHLETKHFQRVSENSTTIILNYKIRM